VVAKSAICLEIVLCRVGIDVGWGPIPEDVLEMQEDCWVNAGPEGGKESIGVAMCSGVWSSHVADDGGCTAIIMQKTGCNHANTCSVDARLCVPV
jgi:hypothetical protein